jgi:ADP-ribosylglycohydrolase
MTIPMDYEERVYAGVLGKIIGVYLGRPFEGWSHTDISKRLGEVYYYKHEEIGVPLIVTDDDISGTFTFLRALEDNGYPPEISPEQIGDAWLNYIIENRTILWWGGMGNSTEHTAFLRLKSGVHPPLSGSIALNGKVVAEQIGAQIFIDGWGLVAPGDPAKASGLAKCAASVSHDGEAIYGAQVIAALVSTGFIEKDIDKMIDTAVSFIPRDSLIHRMIDDIREWVGENEDWRVNRTKLERQYGYETYGGGCHIIPNHGLVILSLLHSRGSFQRALMIVNTCGWDTDCNSGNVGCIMGVRGGLSGIDEGADFRTPVADRLYLSTADGGRGITDALSEAIHISRAGRAIAGDPAPPPKNGARFHFCMPGSVQGFRSEDTSECRGVLDIVNINGHSRLGARSLALKYHGLAPGRPARASTPTFIPPEALNMGGYGVFACPTIYPNQVVTASLEADSSNDSSVQCRLYTRCYHSNGELKRFYGTSECFPPGSIKNLEWRLPDTGADPIAEIGVEISSETGSHGVIYMDYLTWTGEPDIAYGRGEKGKMHRMAWVDGLDHFETWDGFRICQDRGRGMASHGARDWRNYTVDILLTPHLAKATGVAARVQGMTRYYALLFTNDGKLRLVRYLNKEKILAEKDYPLNPDTTRLLSLTVDGNLLAGRVDGETILQAEDSSLTCGAIGLLMEEGRADIEKVRVYPCN